MYSLKTKLSKYLEFKHIAALLIFTAAGLYITYPLILHLTNLISGRGDELLITWILNWNIHSFFTNLPNIFTANIFYPYHNTLAFSDSLFTSSILSLLPVYFFGEPVVAFNFTLISSLILLGLSVYFLTYFMTKSFFPSVISGLLVIFSPPILNETPHLQVISIYFVPLSILFFMKFIESKKAIFLIVTAILFILQVYNSFLPGYFIFFSLLIIYIFYFFKNRKESLKLINKKNLLIIVLSFLILVPIALPYFQVSKQFHYVRDIRDTIHFALQPEDLIYPHPLTRLNPILLKISPKYQSNAELKPGFLGLEFSIFLLISLLFFIKNFKKINLKEKSLVSIALFSLVLSFGPFLHIGRHTIHHPFPIPLPYLFFYYIVPGFNGMRNSARWEILFVLISAVLIGILLSKFFENKNKKKILVYLFLILLIVGEFNFPMKFISVSSIKNFPPEYYWLKDHANNSSLIEMPIYNWDMFPYSNNETIREYYSTLNFNKMVNGFSGFSPLEWEAMVRNMTTEFPNPSTIYKLEQMKVDYVIVHFDQYEKIYSDHYQIRGRPTSSSKDIAKKINDFKKLQLVQKFKDTYIYKLK